MLINFSKYHGLGNEYLVIDKKYADILNVANISRICNVHFGVGSDGILLADIDEKGLFDIAESKQDKRSGCHPTFAVKIFNPDGSEAEKSGNGLRIFSRYLFDLGLVKLGEQFEINTLGGLVKSTVIDKNLVKVEMGEVKFGAFGEKIEILDREFLFNEVNVGNPHCVIILDENEAEDFSEIAQKYGSKIEINKRFENRTNVQFVKIIDRKNICIEIWERGAGYTLASGSSSTAAAALAYKIGLCDSEITVSMQGGKLSLSFNENFNAIMCGAVQKICNGEILNECLLNL